jgi:hypothetical protein
MTTVLFVLDKKDVVPHMVKDSGPPKKAGDAPFTFLCVVLG